jgi:CDP-diacylglycerol--serine O-phosphatidyltransferase
LFSQARLFLPSNRATKYAPVNPFWQRFNNKEKLMLRWIANVMTAGNLVCGSLSVIMAFEGRFGLSAWLILLSIVLDAFDGKAARFFGGSSAFGIQFDSLADVISFGVAPSMLIYTIALQDLGVLGIVVTVTPIIAAAYRLARFNVNTEKKLTYFEGLSSPLHAGLVASFIIMSLSRWGEVVNSNVLAGLVILTSVLMVSHLPLAGMPRFTLREHGANLFKLTLLSAITLFAAINPPKNAFPAILVVVVCGFIYGIAASMRRANSAAAIEDEEDEDLTVPGKQ